MHRDAQLIAEAYTNIHEDRNTMQAARLTYDASLKSLVSQMVSNPDKFWELLKKVPGMYAALLMGNTNKLNEIFRSLGVDVNQIADTVKKSQELFAQYQRDPSSVQIRKAVAAQPLRARAVN